MATALLSSSQTNEQPMDIQARRRNQSIVEISGLSRPMWNSFMSGSTMLCLYLIDTYADGNVSILGSCADLLWWRNHICEVCAPLRVSLSVDLRAASNTKPKSSCGWVPPPVRFEIHLIHYSKASRIDQCSVSMGIATHQL